MKIFGERNRDEEKRKEEKEESEILKVLKDIHSVLLFNADYLADIDSFLHAPRGIIFVFPTITNSLINQGENNMADVTLKQGQSVPVELHYVDANGNDLGVVPASDNPSINVDQPAELALSITGGSGSAKNTNTGTADVQVALSGSAKGFTVVASVVCSGTGAGSGQPAGVKFVFGTPA